MGQKFWIKCKLFDAKNFIFYFHLDKYVHCKVYGGTSRTGKTIWQKKKKMKLDNDSTTIIKIMWHQGK